MLDKLQAVYSRYEELCAKSEQPDFYNDPKKAATLLREKNDLEPIVECYLAYRSAQQDLLDAQELMSDPEMRELGGLCLFEDNRVNYNTVTYKVDGTISENT